MVLGTIWPVVNSARAQRAIYYTPDEIVAIGRHIAAKEKIMIAEDAWPLLHAEATRLRNTPLGPGTALDEPETAAARKVVIASKRECARRHHLTA